jgi:uncharacterized phage infection (PIP) family protein YhgE
VSLITGIISEELVGAQKEDEEHKLVQIQQGKQELAKSVKSLLNDFDEDGNGVLSEEKVRSALAHSDFKLVDHLQALGINMEVEDFMAMLTRLREAHGGDEVPIDHIVESLKHLSGTASASSIWDLKMMLLQLQNDSSSRASGGVNQIPDQLSSVREDVEASASHADKLITELQQTEERLQSQHSKIDGRLASLKGRLDNMEKKLTDEQAAIDSAVIARLGTLEQLVDTMTSSSAAAEQAMYTPADIQGRPTETWGLDAESSALLWEQEIDSRDCPVYN